MAQDNSNASVRILIVDDEFSVRDSLMAWFQDEGYTVAAAASAGPGPRPCCTASASRIRRGHSIPIRSNFPAGCASAR